MSNRKSVLPATVEKPWRRLRRDRGGNIAITAAAALPLLIGSMALAVDYGTLTLERREAQSTADLAAIVAASDLANAEDAVEHFLRVNRLDFVIATDAGYRDRDGETTASQPHGTGVLTIEQGRYVGDGALPVAERFTPGDDSANAARVHLDKRGTLYFASLFAEPPAIATTGTAHALNVASFSIGSRLLSLEGGVLNDVLGGLLGIELALSVMDYEALIGADVSLLSFLDAVAAEIDLTAISYDRLLEEEITVGQFARALAATAGLDTAAARILERIAAAGGGAGAVVSLAQFFDAGPLGPLAIGATQGLDVEATALDMLSAVGALAGGERQLALDIEAGLPGIVAVSAELAIGEPPVGTSWIAVGEKGTIVRTAQTRLRFDVDLLGRGSIASVRLPLYVEVAYGEARLTDIACHAGGGATVSLDARPGIVEAAIGKVGAGDFADFSRTPTVGKADLVTLALVKVAGSAHLEASNLATSRLAFTQGDIDGRIIKTIATRDPLRSLTASLVERLDLEIRLGALPLFDLSGVDRLLGEILQSAASPLDRLVHNTLLALGIKVGEAELRVSGAECGRATLVQ